MKLSLCMPVYNFGPFMGETLDSIIPQLKPGVEIVILDGGSSDNTAEVAAAYCAACPQIRYIRQDHRGGIDRDMARSIDLSEGEYFWLFSGDDLMKPGALDYVLEQIESGLDVYLCGLTLCDRHMNVIADHKVSHAPDGAIYNLTDMAQRKDYFEKAITTTAFFSFMGSLIMRREWWDRRPFDERFDRTCWAHVARMMGHMDDRFTVKYLKNSLQLKRGDNDSFMDKGLVHRYAIAIDGYHRIADEIFGHDSFEARQIRRVIVNEFPPKAMFYTKVDFANAQQPGEVAELDRLAAKTYCDNTPRNRMYRFLYKYTPVWCYNTARTVYKSLKKLLRKNPAKTA